jgi:hypothetical protein
MSLRGALSHGRTQEHWSYISALDFALDFPDAGAHAQLRLGPEPFDPVLR